MTHINKALKNLRKSNNLTIIELSENIHLSPATISLVENEKKKPTFNILAKYSKYFNIPIEELEDSKTVDNFANMESNNPFKKNLLTIPYFESISSGDESSLTEDYPLEFIQVPLPDGSYSDSSNLIGVKINGDSMNRVLPNHSIAVIDKGANINNDDIVAYQLDNDFGLKKFFKTSDKILLVPQSFNPVYKTKELNIEDLHYLDNFQIVGKLIYNYNLF